jgi:hypothetical protein
LARDFPRMHLIGSITTRFDWEVVDLIGGTKRHTGVSLGKMSHGGHAGCVATTGIFCGADRTGFQGRASFSK